MRHASIFAICLAVFVANTTAATASTRLYCTCKTGPKTVLQHNNACAKTSAPAVYETLRK
jgi:hypothetical protein